MLTVGKRLRNRTSLRCTLCGQEIVPGEEYWACNGQLACALCLPELARRELALCREVRGREERP